MLASARPVEQSWKMNYQLRRGKLKSFMVYSTPPPVLTWLDFKVWIMRSGKGPRRLNLKLQPDYELLMMKQHLKTVRRFLRIIGMS